MNRPRPVTRWGAVALVAVLAALGAPAGAAAQASVDETCVTARLKSDAAAANIAFPDENATYWVTPFAAVPGTRLRIDGRFPHARYISFNTYDNLLQPIDVLTDHEIDPEPGHANPFRRGHRRDRERRSYTAFVEFGPPPADPARNTLYTGDVKAAAVIYRVYVPDRGYGPSGGAGVPTVTAELSGSGTEERSSPCAEREQALFAFLHPLNELIASANGVPTAEVLPFPGYSEPRWRKFDNLPKTVISGLFGNDYTGELAPLLTDPLPDTGNGGFLSNIDNAYMATLTNRAHGRVLVTKMRAPRAPATRRGPARMPGGQLRYFSLCTNEFLTQRYFSCLLDEKVKTRGRRRKMTIVTSTPEDRPANARRRCGINWLRNGPLYEGVLIYRHMLPRPGFRRSIQAAAVGDERATMKRYAPRSRYFATPADFDRKHPCDG